MKREYWIAIAATLVMLGGCETQRDASDTAGDQSGTTSSGARSTSWASIRPRRDAASDGC